MANGYLTKMRPRVGSNVASYVKMANKFLKDKDAPEGKALRYYMAMKK